jgi:tetrapyrrole methylase family protein/MazG family protein
MKTPGDRFDAFVDLIARLRGPGGCPWDREQTHESLKPMTLEEAYEVVEAIDQGDSELAAELGDLLLQVVFHAQIATEEKRFTVGDVIEGIAEKMTHRHPHVFGDENAQTASDVLRNWEALKEAERASDGKRVSSMLDSVSPGLPAVMEAFQTTTKASRVGFDFKDRASVLSKLDEEVTELKDALVRSPERHEDVFSEIGDLLFAAVNVARVVGVDPESALKACNRKFRRRFQHIEARLRERGKKPADSSLDEMDALWNEAKAKGL